MFKFLAARRHDKLKNTIFVKRPCVVLVNKLTVVSESQSESHRGTYQRRPGCKALYLFEKSTSHLPMCR